MNHHFHLSHISCGVVELSGLYNHKGTEHRKILESVANPRVHYHYYNQTNVPPTAECQSEEGYNLYALRKSRMADKNFAFVLFSDNTVNFGGSKFATLITENKLGGLTETPAVTNPNSHRQIIVWVWAPDREAIRKYLAEHPEEKKENDKLNAKFTASLDATAAVRFVAHPL